MRRRGMVVTTVLAVLMAPVPASAGVSFDDVSRRVGVTGSKGRTWGATFVDYDLDGWPDLMVGRHRRRPDFFVNRRGRFERKRIAALEEFPEGRSYYDRHSCAWGEATGDGLPDLYCVSGAQKGTGWGPNQLLAQTLEHDLVNVTKRYRVADRYGRGRSVSWLDHDGDGRLDIFVGNELRPGHPNRLFHHAGDHYRPIDAGVALETAATSSSWADIDGDSRPDLTVQSHGIRGSVIYRNTGSTFAAVSMANITGTAALSAAWGHYDDNASPDVALVDEDRLLVAAKTGGGFHIAYSRALSAGRVAVWLDADNDGDQDLFVVQGSPRPEGGGDAPDLLLRRTERGFRAVRSRLSRPVRGGGDSAAAADFDRDGRVDLVVVNGHAQASGATKVFRNTSRARHWFELRLDGGRRNPYGFGARVELVSRSLRYHRYVTDGANYQSQSSVSPVHLGMGRDTRARVRVVWSDGTTDCVAIRAGGFGYLAKGSAPCGGGRTVSL